MSNFLILSIDAVRSQLRALDHALAILEAQMGQEAAEKAPVAEKAYAEAESAVCPLCGGEVVPIPLTMGRNRQYYQCKSCHWTDQVQ